MSELSFQEAEDQLLLDTMRNDLLSYAMGMHPKFIANDFAEGVAREIQDVLEGKNDRLILIGPPRHGKSAKYLELLTFLDLDGNIKNGVFGDLQVGYKVLHHSGKWCNVTARGETHKINARVTLSTGETLDVHENHEWLVRDVKETRRANKNFKANNRNKVKRGEQPDPVPSSFDVWKVIETKELFNDNVHVDPSKAGKRGSRYRYMTPRMKAAEFPKTFQKIDPYWFGYWLGDGNSKNPSVYVGGEDKEVCITNMSKIYDITKVYTHGSTGVLHIYFGGQDLRKHLPLNNKHIPDEYKLCSIEQRKQLLAGLIDSDGHVCKKSGRVRFVNTNKSIIDDVAWIARSLGWNAYITHQEAVISSSGVQGNQRVYTVAFNPDSDIPTIYERKKIKITKEASEIAIIHAEMIPENEREDGFCIEVDSPDHTYVIGETFITTHNSFMTSEFAPAWFLGKFPTKKIICASHTATLAADFGGKVRDNISSPMHEAVFGASGSLDPKKAAAENFRTRAKGEYFAVGVGGTPIGKGADVYIIDDPIRNREDVESEPQRQKLKDWYSSAVLSRLEGQSGIILMHQRWHEDDLAGWLLKEYADDGWRVVHFPAVIETDEDEEVDYLGRSKGEALIPELHSYDKLMRLKRTMLPRDWNSMYQGFPRAVEGNEFTEAMLMRYEQDPQIVRHGLNVYILVDPANSKDKYSDYTAMGVIGVGADGNYYLLDLVRDKLDLSERANTLIDLHRRWRPIAVGYEQYGAQSDIQHIEYIQNEQNYRFAIHKITASKRPKKIERIRRLIPDMTNGRWFFPKFLTKINHEGNEHDPVHDMIQEEMLGFPDPKHDDAIDCISSIYDMNVLWPSASRQTQGHRANTVSPW